MIKKHKLNKRFLKYRLYGYPLFAILLFLVFNLINPLEGLMEWYRNYTVYDFVVELGFLLIFTSVTIESGIFTTIALDRYFLWENRRTKRAVSQFLLQIFFLSGLYPLFLLITSCIHTSVISMDDSLLIRQAAILGILFSVIITAFFTAEYFFLNWSKTRLKASLLEKKALESELSALRTQINPHFLFNNFSTLTALIEDDKSDALNFLEKLISVYRYLLTYRNKNMVSLEDESFFINSYLYLYQVRYGKNLIVDVQISPEQFHKLLPPLTLQLLIENAVKHNTISLEEPLHLKIHDKVCGQLIIENNINIKTVPEESTGLGLNNIDKRYKLLGFEKGIAVENTDQTFKVTIPLIDHDN